VTEIFLPKYNVEFCKGCLRCVALGKCPISDDHEVQMKLLYEADGIIVGSPNYGFSPNAMMKRFLERLGMFLFFSSAFGGKYIAGISSSGGVGGAKKVAKNLTYLLSNGIFQRGYVSGILGAGSSASKETKTLGKARELGRKIANDIKTGKNYPLQNIFGRLLMKFVMKPIMQKYILKNKEGDTKAVYQNLYERGLI
jgi:multimeric flavodoxin WrbA